MVLKMLVVMMIVLTMLVVMFTMMLTAPLHPDGEVFMIKMVSLMMIVVLSR